MGNYSKSLAMGLVLIGIAVFTNSVIHRNAEEGK
jgi:ABC-type tungstate transport system substrate-binding protein